MYNIDDSFLESVGLGGLPADQKSGFMQYAQDQLEIRIGEKMCNNLNEAQLDEFEKIIDNDQEMMQKWLAAAGDYKNNEVYQKLVEAAGGDSAEVENDFVTAVWLNRNCPQYQQLIDESMNEIREEITKNKDQILANA